MAFPSEARKGAEKSLDSLAQTKLGQWLQLGTGGGAVPKMLSWISLSFRASGTDYPSLCTLGLGERPEHPEASRRPKAAQEGRAPRELRLSAGELRRPPGSARGRDGLGHWAEALVAVQGFDSSEVSVQIGVVELGLPASLCKRWRGCQGDEYP